MDCEDEPEPLSTFSPEPKPMAEDDEEMPSSRQLGTILYELLVFCEWRQEPRLETPERPPAPSLRHWSAGLWAAADPSPPGPIAELTRAQPAWHLSLSGDGRLLAVLQEETLEVRAARDDFTSIVARAVRPADPRPQWRRLRWSPPLTADAGALSADAADAADAPLLAIAASSGAVDVLDAALSPVCVIYPAEFGRVPVAAVAELVWAPALASRWQATLLVVFYSGEVAAYHISARDGYEEAFRHTLKLYPRGITSATYDERRRLLVVAGETGQVGRERLQGLGSCEGITCWRLLPDQPHLRHCQSVQEQEAAQSFSWLPWRRTRSPWDPVTALSLCPASRRLLSAHRSGAITVWEFPSLRKQSHWPLEAQPGRDAVSPELLQLPTAQRQRRLRALAAGATRPAAVSWWSAEAAIIARRNGAVTVSHAETLENLLGESPEFFSGSPRVGAGPAAGDGQSCLVLECERRTESVRKRADSGRLTDEEDGEDEEEEPTPGMPRRMLDGVRWGLHWLTDSERFEPARRRPRLTHTLYRLTCLRSTTPQQLFTRKIELGEYGEALMLAEAYSLDSDLVFLKQWQKCDVSAESIADCLGRISRRALVLNECVSRVPAQLSAARLLLEHGLRGTDLEAVLAAADPADTAFHPCDPRRCYDDLPADQLALRERAARRQLLAQLGASRLTPAQRQLTEYRRRLLGYRERLMTYGRLIGGEERYDPAEYSRFRDRTVLEAALEFAHLSQWESVQVMLRYHGHELLPHRLLLLSHLPETTEPTLYAPLLPQVDVRGAVVRPETERWDEPDWVDSLLLDDDSPKHRPLPVECPPFAAAGRDLSAAQLTAWYAGRAREMVNRSCLVGHGLDLVQLGRERNVPGLEPLRDELDTLATLVYDAGHLEVTLDSFAKMTPSRVVELMMADATEATFVSQVRCRLLPYLARREVAEPGSSAALLHEFVMRLAKDDLTLPSLLVQHSAAAEPRPLVSDAGQLTALALDAVYACPKPESASAARGMVAALPPAPDAELRERREVLAAQLAAAEVLARHGQRLSAAELARVAGDEEGARALMERLSRTELRQERAPAEPDCRRLLDDMLEMQQKVFQVVSPQTCHEIFVSSLLTSARPSNIVLAGSLMCTDPAERPAVTNVYLRKLPHDVAARLVVAAAAEYFDASSSLVDSSMELARQCLQLIKDPPKEVRRELGLVDSLEYLVQFGVSLLPVQVRLTPDKLTLLERCLDARPDAYRQHEALLKLGQLLDVPDGWRLLRLTAARALRAGDPAAAARACRHLVDGQHTSTWDICRQVAECDTYRDIDNRLELLSFSLLHCPAAELERLLRLRQRLLADKLCQKLERLAEPQETARGAEGGDGGRSAGEGRETAGAEEEHRKAPADLADRGDVPPDVRSPGDGEACPPEAAVGGQAGSAVSLLRSTRGLTGHLVRATASTIQGTTRAVLQATSDTTRAVLQATSGGTRALVSGQLPDELRAAGSATASILRATVSRLAPGQRAESDGAVTTNAALLRPGVPPFAAAAVPGCHESVLEPDYRSFDPPAPAPPLLVLAVSVARVDALRAVVETRRPAPPAVETLQELLPLLLAEDTALALCWALALSDADLRGCTACWPQTELALRAAAYCVALRLAVRHGKGEDVVTETPPDELIAAGLETTQPDELRQLLEELCAKVEDARQSRQLLRLDRGVDVARFAAEPAYQRDTILGLAMSDEEAALAAAGRLARRYGVPAAELARAQIVYLFSTPELAAEEVRERLRRRALVEQALEQPEELAAALRELVLPTLAGVDHERLLLYHSLLLRADPSAAAEVTSRVTLLHLIHGSGVDFCRLLSADADELADLLSPAVSAENVDALEELAPRLGSGPLTSSAVAAAWLVSAVERSAEPRRRALQAERARLQRLQPADLERCAGRLVFSDSALHLSLSARQEVLADLREATEQRKPEQAWDAVRARLDGWQEHLEYLEWDSYAELLESSDDDVYRFARLFDQTRGESERLRVLRTRMVVDGCHLSAMKQIMSVFPMEEVAPVEDVLLEALRETVSRLRARQATGDLRSLAAVVAQLKQYMDSDGEGLSVDQVVAEFRQLCDDPQVDVGRRVKAARLLTTHFTVDRDLFPALVHAETVSALPGVALTASDTRDAAGRRRLLDRLLLEADSVDRLRDLLRLLPRWPAFPADVMADPDRNPLCALCARALELDAGESGRGLVVAAAAEHGETAALPAAAHARLVQLLEETSGGAVVALETALLSRDPEIRRQAIRRAEDALAESEAASAAADGGRDSPAPAGDAWPLAAPVLDSLLAAGALPLLVGSPLYEPAVTRLLDGGGDPAAAVAQLRAAGCDAEAGVLLLRARAARPPAGQSTIHAAKQAATKVFSKWLH